MISTLPEINIAQPKVRQVECSREELSPRYIDLLAKNPLLARIEGSCRTIGWSDVETRTFQLLTAVASNASLQQRLTELEASLARHAG